MDFFTTEVWTPLGLTTYYVLFVIDLKSRRVHFAGATPTPNESFMAQVARNLIDAFDGCLTGHRFLICDRDSKFSESFRRVLQGAGVEVILTPMLEPGDTKDFGNFNYGFVTYVFEIPPIFRDFMADIANLWEGGQLDPPEASEQIENGSMFASYMHGCLKENNGIGVE